MLTEDTMRKLHEMRLTVMARTLREQLQDPAYNDMPFEDRVSLLVDREWCARKSNQLARLKKAAHFADPSACVENIEYHADRCLDKTMIARLATCAYITEAHNVILMGATGTGKTYLACALGMAAVRNFIKVRYVRLPELFTELAIARGDGSFSKVIQQYKRPALLILDEWLLYGLKETEARDLLEIIEARHTVASTIFCSQFSVRGWQDKIGDPILADAICDRIVHDSYSLVMEGKKSMRNLSTYFKFPEEVRRLIYTTNAIEGFNRQLRKVIKSKSVFPTDDSLLKTLYTAMIDIMAKWADRRQDWA